MNNVYYINIDEDDCFMNAISLVKSPAVEVDFISFDAQDQDEIKHMLKMRAVDEDQHCITGVVCLADVPIYRYDNIRGEYYVVFTKEVIKQMVLKYSQMNLFNSVNLQHDSNKYVDSVFMVETYIKDEENGICPKAFEKVPNGSLFITYKVTDDDLWEEIKNGNEFNGFSLEITALLEEKNEEKMNKQNKDVDSIESLLNEIFN